MKARLTDVLIQKQKVPVSGRIEIFDSQVPGFGVRIGVRERSFFFIRRVNGRKVRMSLGVFPSVSLARARSQALSILDRIKAGEDPTPEIKRRTTRPEQAEEPRFSQVAERFLEQYCRGKKKPLRERTVEEYKRHLTGPLVTAWKNRPISSITEKDLLEVIDLLEGRSQFATARLFKSYARKFFGWCVERHLVSRNPAISVPLGSRPSDFVRERVLPVEELRVVLRAADKLGAPYRAFVYVLVLCGQRRHETSIMQWSDLNLEGDKLLWRIAGETTKNHRPHDVPLSREVAQILEQLPRTITHNSPTLENQATVPSLYVLSGDGKAPISGFSKLKSKLDDLIEADRRSFRKDEKPLAHWVWHDLRRSAATGLSNLGVSPHVVEAVLNHVSGAKAGVAGVYNKSTYEDERRRALEAWAAKILANDTDPKVIPLAKFA